MSVPLRRAPQHRSNGLSNREVWDRKGSMGTVTTEWGETVEEWRSGDMAHDRESERTVSLCVTTRLSAVLLRLRPWVDDRVLADEARRGVDVRVSFRVLALTAKYCACQGESVRSYWVAGDRHWIRVLETHDGRKLTRARTNPLSLMLSPARLVATANVFPMSKGAHARAGGITGNRRRLKIGG